MSTDTSRPAVQALIADLTDPYATVNGAFLTAKTAADALAALLDERDAAREYVKVHSGLTATDRESELGQRIRDLADEMKRADENYDDMHEWRSKARKLAAKLDAVKAAVERCTEDRLGERMQSTPVVAKATIRALLADTDEGSNR